MCAFLLVLALCAIPFKAHAQQIDIPKLYFRGNISHMYEKSDVRKINFQYTGQDQIFTGFALIKIQGTSSLGYEGNTAQWELRALAGLLPPSVQF